MYIYICIHARERVCVCSRMYMCVVLSGSRQLRFVGSAEVAFRPDPATLSCPSTEDALGWLGFRR